MTEIREAHKLALAAEMLAGNHPIRMQALGTSMLPSIWPGDILSIEPRTSDEIVPGDIVLVSRQSRFFIHRAVERRASYWITRGDSVPQNDEPATDVEVLGKVALIHKTSGSVVPKLQLSPLNRILAYMLCHWDSLRCFALRVRQFLAEERSISNPEALHCLDSASPPAALQNR